MNRWICLDTETCGVTLDMSLLTAYFAVLDENLSVVDELELNLKPESGVYNVTAQALNVNKINLVEHDKIAIPYREAKPLLYNFLKQNYQGEKLTPIGHGVKFDVEFTKKYLIGPSWEDFVSYRMLCTSSAVQFLRAAGLFPDDVSGSLGSLVGYFKLPSQGEFHTAKTDALQTVAVFKELLKLVKS